MYSGKKQKLSTCLWGYGEVTGVGDVLVNHLLKQKRWQKLPPFETGFRLLFEMKKYGRDERI
jgi:hypothetical protein